MTKYFCLLLAVVALSGCKKDKEEELVVESPGEPSVLNFQSQEYSAKTKLPCKGTCTYVSISVPEAAGGDPVVADSINKKIFNTVRKIVYFGEKPTNAANYDEIMSSFIKSYEDLATKYPEEAIPWEAKIKATQEYASDSLINIKVNNYMFTGGAHGYEGNLSLLFDAKTGRTLTKADLFSDVEGFTAYAEKEFRKHMKIPAGKSINSKGLMFENDKFKLPENIFFNKEGIVLLYNPYEVGSFADGPEELTLSFEEVKQYLKMK